MKKKINVLSLFGGMETLRQSLIDLNIKANNYYSSEVKPCAIKFQKHKYPNIIQLGDINNWQSWSVDWKGIDFVGSGSPCQDLSIAGKRKGITGDRSKLFFVFVDILNHVKKLNPDVIFLQENVGGAPKEDIRIMSESLNILPVKINSKLLTAQLRDRYYWTNINVRTDWTGYNWTNIPQPKDKHIMFRDIIENGSVKKDKAYTILESESRPLKNETKLLLRSEVGGFVNIVYIKNNEVMVKTNTTKGYDILTENDCLNLSFPKSTTRRGGITKGKSPCLLAGNEPLYSLKGNKIRILSQIELERLQGFQDGHTSMLTRNEAAGLLGDGWTLPVINHILSFLNYD